MSNLACPTCGCATVPGMTCPCPPVATPAELARRLARHYDRTALREKLEDEARAEREPIERREAHEVGPWR